MVFPLLKYYNVDEEYNFQGELEALSTKMYYVLNHLLHFLDD